MTTPERRQIRAGQQLMRRIAKRTCGLCGEQAEVMMPWADQSVPICGSCKVFLDSRRYRAPFCSYYEVSPERIGLEPQEMTVDTERVESRSGSSAVERALRWLRGP